MSQSNSNVADCKNMIFLVYFIIWKNKNAIRGKFLEAIRQTAPPLATDRGLQNSLQSYTSTDVMTICKSVSEILYTDCDVMAIVAVVVVVAVAYLEFQCCRIE